MKFDWDEAKAATNWGKHGVSFDEAATIFGDPLAATFSDGDHSVGERRWLTVGSSLSGRLLVVAHTEDELRIRIISARQATAHERSGYERGR